MSSILYREPDLNRHVPCETQDFKSCASTNSAIPAVELVNSLIDNLKIEKKALSIHKVPIYKFTQFAEAPIRFELMHKGFADLSLTTWVRRQTKIPSNKSDGIERETGLEPATSTLARLRSTN
jgi:hypothetical protein